MTNQDIQTIALRQSAIDLNCDPQDFLQPDNKIVISAPHDRARKYLQLPFDCNLVSYGQNIVASVRPDMISTVQAYMDRYPAVHCFETPHLHILNDALTDYGLRICFMAEYFLPDMRYLQTLSCPYTTRSMGPADFADLYTPEWSNALCEKRKHLDVLGVGAYDGNRLVGLAACSADGDDMWQIGIDVLPAYRRQGVASALTSRLAMDILERGKVPFYCAAWSNIYSVRNAIKSGFRPAWVEMTAKSTTFIETCNT